MPSSKSQTTFTKSVFGKPIYCLGDSITLNYQGGVLPSNHYPSRMAKHLRTSGANCFARNLGLSGFTSTQLLAVVPNDLQFVSSISPRGVSFEVPIIATVMIGVNDPGSGIVQATTQSNIQQIIKAIKNGVQGVVAAPTNLPAYQPGGFAPFVPNVTRYIVTADNSTTGGYNVGSPLSPPTVTGDLSGAPVPRCWVYRNAQAGVAGWSRVADNTDATVGCQNILILSAHWLNFANAGGDTLGADYATYVPVRAAQLAAANAESVPFFDLHAYLRAQIVAGVVGDSSGAWSAWANNQHPNSLAHETYATGIYNVLMGDNTYVTSTAQMPTGANSWVNTLLV